MKPRACIVVASEMTVRTFLVRQIAAMHDRFDVTVVVNTTNPRLQEELGIPARVWALPIQRDISPLSDLACLARLTRFLRTERFDLVHSLTPKAGLLAMTAAWLARTPVRLHTFTGQVWATRTGVARAALKMVDGLVAQAATCTLADSRSQREFLVAERVSWASRITVPGNGSVSGVDTARFRPDPAVRRAVRASLGISERDLVLLFVGRIHRDKGVVDLARAFATLADSRSDIHLVLVGPDEQRLIPVIRHECHRHRARLHFCDFTSTPERFMAASDILCLPSFREGFGSVIIEAAAAGVPAVASRIYGVVDAVVDGETGLLHQPGNVDELVQQLDRLVASPELRRSLGQAARRRAERDFSQEVLTSAMLAIYQQRLESVGRADCSTAHTRSRQSRPSQVTAPGMYARHGKRAADIAAAFLGIVLLLPLGVCLALTIRMFLGSPVLFRQTRPGRHGIPFTIVKFRTMTDARDEAGRPLPDAQRLTRFGRFLRATSLDEIPELWNVLVGDMSLVGPRPLLMEYLPRYTPQQARRHELRPGITGLAQVSGRNGLSWVKRFELDVEYVERCSPGLDIRILARTVGAVIAQHGIAQPGRATVDYFEGNVAHHG